MAMPTKMLSYLDMFSAFNHALMDSTALGYEQSIVGRQVAEGAAKSTDHVRAAPHSEKARSARPMPSEGSTTEWVLFASARQAAVDAMIADHARFQAIHLGDESRDERPRLLHVGRSTRRGRMRRSQFVS